jgi:hypothetical protein
MSRTVGHRVDRYEGHKLFLRERRDRKFGKRQSVKAALRKGEVK